VWRVALYLLIALVIIGAVGTAVLIPVGVRVFHNEYFTEEFAALTQIMRDGGSLADLFEGVREFGRYFFEVVGHSVGSIISLAFFAVVVVGILSRFLLGLYELPLTEVMESYLTSNAKISFMGRIVASMGRSSKLVFFKSLFLLAYDIVMVVIVFGALNLLLVHAPSVRFLAEFTAMVLLIGLLACRSTLVANWTPLIVVDKIKPHKALGASFGAAFGSFGKLYSNYLVIWVCIIIINYIAAVYTFGAALIITLPLSAVFVKIFNIVYFFNKTNRRYYINGEIFAPAGEVEIEN